MMVYIIPYEGELFKETRQAYFLKAFGESVKEMRIIPFGKCNYSCPYCKRNGYKKQSCIIEGSVAVNESVVFNAVLDAINKGQIVRLSGGDPCTYPSFSIKLLKFVKKHGGTGSMAHNGSSPILIKHLVDNHLLDSLSVDLKAETPEKLGKIAGISPNQATIMWDKTIQTLKVLKYAKDVKVDIRTCVFNDTEYEELLKIGEIIQKNSSKNVFWTLRKYSVVDNFSTETKDTESMKELAQMLSSKLPNLKIGIRVKWDNGAFFYYMNGKEC